MRLSLVIIFIFSLGLAAQAQFSEIQVSFKAVYNNNTIELNKPFTTENNDTIDISVLKFYISNIELQTSNISAIVVEEHLHLIDFSNEKNTFKIELPAVMDYYGFRFNLGIDSLTNVSGANGGDLDPTKGMYWTWQSGYINFKLEGHSKLSPARKNEITFHLGGYLPNELAVQSVSLPIKSKDKIEIVLDLKPWIESLDFKKEYKLMSPGQRAVEWSKIIANSFSSQ